MPFDIDGELETFVWVSLRESGLSSPSFVNNIRREPSRREGIKFLIDDYGKIRVYPAYSEISLTQIL
jgi:hypothetical protein